MVIGYVLYGWYKETRERQIQNDVLRSGKEALKVEISFLWRLINCLDGKTMMMMLTQPFHCSANVSFLRKNLSEKFISFTLTWRDKKFHTSSTFPLPTYIIYHLAIVL